MDVRITSGLGKITLMVVSIVANSSARTAQDAINVRNQRMALSSQQLASGQRVFSAAQDPAALAVGTTLKLENIGLRTAALNAVAGSSMLQIADGALGQISDILIRLRTLATQASSGQLGDTERALLENEFTQMRSELDRIARTAEFNGVRMLTGSNEIVPDYAALATNGITSMRFDDTLVTADRAYRYSYDATNETLTMERVDAVAAASQTFDITGLLDTVAGLGQNLGAGQSIEVSFAQLGVTMTLGSGFVRGTPIVSSGTSSPAVGTTVTTPTFSFPTTSLTALGVNGIQTLGAEYAAATGVLTLPLVSDGTAVTLPAIPNLAYAINGGPIGTVGAISGDLVSVGASYVDVHVAVAGGGTERIGRLSFASLATTLAGTGSITLEVGKGLLGADVTGLTTSRLLTYKVGNGVAVGQDLVNVRIAPVTSIALGLDPLTVTTVLAANSAITALDAAQVQLNSIRANVGAQQARMEYIANNIDVVIENNESSRSALLDVDASQAISDLTTETTMLQVAITMLSQANQMGDRLLELLRQQ
jgi:flagellin